MDQVGIARRAYADKQQALAGGGGHRQSRRVVRLAEVLRLTGIKSRETIRSLERRELFPQWFPLIPNASPNDRSVPKGWDEGEILRWIEERKEELEE